MLPFDDLVYAEPKTEPEVVQTIFSPMCDLLTESMTEFHNRRGFFTHRCKAEEFEQQTSNALTDLKYQHHYNNRGRQKGVDITLFDPRIQISLKAGTYTGSGCRQKVHVSGSRHQTLFDNGGVEAVFSGLLDRNYDYLMCNVESNQRTIDYIKYDVYFFAYDNMDFENVEITRSNPDKDFYGLVASRNIDIRFARSNGWTLWLFIPPCHAVYHRSIEIHRT